MIDRKVSVQDIRTMLSMYAVSLAALICHAQRHFTIALSHPSTWHAATQHRCGLLLIATLTWLLCEATGRVCFGTPSSQRF
jgi:hypothetical protein